VSVLDFDAAPYIPILGSVACAMGQVDEATFVADPEAQAAALQQVGSALGASALTVGWRSEPDVMLEALKRIPGRALVALLSAPSPAAAREACEAGAAAIILHDPPADASGSKFKQTARAAAHYGVPVILADLARPDADAVAFAAAAGLAGAVITEPTGDEPGIVGGGLAPGSIPNAPPRAERFFWTFPGEVPASIAPEDLVALGERLARERRG
jgi:hypothetical protein